MGWSNVIDTPAIFKLDSTSGQPYILAWANAKIANQTATCSPLAKAGAAQTTAAWINYVTSHPGLKASAPKTIDFGGITGKAIDLEILPSWKTTCPNHGAGPYVMVSVAEGGDYGVGSDSRLHVTFVDVGGKAVVLQVYGPLDAAQFASTLARVTPVIQSMRFPGG